MTAEPKFTDPRARKLGKRIRRIREDFPMTQAQLAEATGLNQGHISQIETGQRLPTIPTLIKIRMALGLTDDQFSEWFEAVA